MDAMLFNCDVASATWQSWHGIPWSGANQAVARLQARIAKAAKAGEWRKVRSLQFRWTVTKSLIEFNSEIGSAKFAGDSI